MPVAKHLELTAVLGVRAAREEEGAEIGRLEAAVELPDQVLLHRQALEKLAKCRDNQVVGPHSQIEALILPQSLLLKLAK